jgi:exosortase E/protease (VPEID-CTERM system)
LIAELVVLTLPFDPRGSVAKEGFWAGALFWAQEGIRPAFITAVMAAVFLSRRVLREEFQRIFAEPDRPIISARWISVHLVLLSVLVLGTRTAPIQLTSVAVWGGWLFLWSVVAAAALLTWLFSALPPSFWSGWIYRSRSSLAAGIVAGISAYALGGLTQRLWWPFQHATFETVVLLLRPLGQATVVRPDLLMIGTSRFQVTIAPQCSGLEGIGLVCAFVGTYLWICRSHFRFPQAFFLFPIAALSIWVLNAARIAALILVGSYDANAAVKGFHSVAGWIVFNFVIIGVIWLSSHSSAFTKAQEPSASRGNEVSGFIVPAVVLYGTSLVTSAQGFGFELSRSLVALSVLIALWCYRSTLYSLVWKPSRFCILAGTAIFAIVLLTSASGTVEALPLATFHESHSHQLLFFLFCLSGVLAIPIAEELAFRGYLARKLVSSEVETVGFNQFTYLSFLGSSLAFGLAHGNWIAATLAGMAFAAVMYRRGLLSDAICAHVCCNGLLLFFGLATGKLILI